MQKENTMSDNDRVLRIIPWQYRHDTMRVAICGASGLGKTTLSRDLAEFTGYPLIEDGVRGYIKEKKLTMSELTDKQVMKFQRAIWERKRAAEGNRLEFISDTSSLDFMVYAMRELGQKMLFQRGVMDYINECMIHAATQYDVLFMLPYGQFEPENDGVRSHDMPVKRIMTHMLIEQAAVQHGPAFHLHHISAQQVPDRVAECIKVLDWMVERKAEAYAEVMSQDILSNEPPLKTNSVH
jgi:nicotinamide riboside kinase